MGRAISRWKPTVPVDLIDLQWDMLSPVICVCHLDGKNRDVFSGWGLDDVSVNRALIDKLLLPVGGMFLHSLKLSSRC